MGTEDMLTCLMTYTTIATTTTQPDSEYITEPYYIHITKHSPSILLQISSDQTVCISF
uniref:Uncharacterized protein n=1 Tax=Arion vulgaris TaxID=1028688 RepID=A0A0B6ZMC8_9EUPU